MSQSSLHSRSLARLVIIALVVIVLVVGAFAYYLLRHGPPYPSEQTPVSLTSDGVRWTRDSGKSAIGLPYNHVEVAFLAGKNLSRWKNIDNTSLNNGTPVSIDFGSGQTGNLTLVSLKLTETTGNGELDTGDYFSFVLLPGLDFESDVVYEIRILYHDPIWWFFFYTSFAFHDGDFYTWDSTPPHGPAM